MNTEKKGAAEATPCKVLFSQLTIVVMTSEEAADVARLGSDINSLAPPAASCRTQTSGGDYDNSKCITREYSSDLFFTLIIRIEITAESDQMVTLGKVSFCFKDCAF